MRESARRAVAPSVAPSVAPFVALIAGLPAGAAAHGGGLDWQAPPAEALYVLLPLLLGSGLYLAGVARRLASPGLGPRQAGRALAFSLGLVLLAIALIWPLDAWAERAFSAHMGQHMVLLVLAPPLLLAGRPLSVWLRALPAAWRPGFVAWRDTVAPPALRGWLARAGPASWLHGAALWAWHAPWLFELALRNDLVHWLEHLTLLGSGLLFWWVLMRAPRQALGPGLLALLATVIHSGLLGALITLAPRPLYGIYAERGAMADVLADQQLAGLIMWVPMGTVYLVAALVLAGRALRSPESPGGGPVPARRPLAP